MAVQMEDANRDALMVLLRRWSSGSDEPLPAAAQINFAAAESSQQAVEAIALEGLGEDPIEEEVRMHWIKRSVQRIGKSRAVQQAQAELVRILEQANVPYMILKGAAAAQYYPNPSYRAMGDIDFLVPHAMLEQTRVLLENNGFALEQNHHDLEWNFSKDGVKLEMHLHVSRLPAPELQETVDRWFEQGLDTAVERENEWGRFRAPAPALNGLMLLLHAQRHLTKLELGLRQVMDFAMFVRSADMQTGAEQLREYCRVLHLETFLHTMVKLCVLYFDVPAEPVSFCMDADDGACALVMSACFESGNFGHKNDGQTTIVGKHGRRGESRVHTAMRNLITGAKNTMPVMQKCPPLLIFAPFCMSARYFWRVLRGKRKMPDIGYLQRTAKIKSQLTQSLKMFEE